MRFIPAGKSNTVVFRWGLVLALAGALSYAAFPQDAPPQQTDRPPSSSATQQPPPSPNRPPAPPTSAQNPNRPPVTSEDRVPNQAPSEYPDENPPDYPRQARPAPTTPPRDQLTVPAGTVLMIRTNEPLSTNTNQVGDQFTGTLEQPLVVNGWVVARHGQTVVGKVKSIQKAGRIKGVSQLGVELTDVTLVDGSQAPILTELWRGSGGTSHGADAATIGGTTALGAIIGSAADWGRGAAIGAGVGAAAGIGAVLLTRGRPTVIPPESQLTFRLVDPVKVDTTRSRQAFLPVTQEDFGRNQRPSLRARYGPYGPYGAYPPAPCGYYYLCYGPGYYGPGYFGVYPSLGWWGYYGPRRWRRW